MNPEQGEMEHFQIKVTMKQEIKLVKYGSKIILAVGIILEILWLIGWFLGYLNFYIFIIPFILFISVGYFGLKSKHGFRKNLFKCSIRFLCFIMGFILFYSMIAIFVGIVRIYKDCDYTTCSTYEKEGAYIFMISSALAAFTSIMTPLCWYISYTFNKYISSSSRYKMLTS